MMAWWYPTVPLQIGPSDVLYKVNSSLPFLISVRALLIVVVQPFNVILEIAGDLGRIWVR